MSNPETRLVWDVIRPRLVDLRALCLVNLQVPPYWHRVETSTGSGFPDLWWGWHRQGLIELKHRAAPPVGEDTPCVIDSITAHQRLFWRQAHESGTPMHVLTRVGVEWFLHDGDWARRYLGLVPMSDMRQTNLLTVWDHPVKEAPTARDLLTLCGATVPA